MYGWFCTWSSQIPRPQKRHVPTAARRQCQQFIVGIPPQRLWLVLLHTIERDRGIERSRSERVLHELVEPFPVQSEGPDWGERPDGRCTRCVQEQSDLTEMIAGSHGPYPDPVFQHLDLARGDGV